MPKHHFGWKPPLPDIRDLKYDPNKHDPQPYVIALPPSVDLRSQMPPIYDQGPLGSCTANSIGAGVQFLQKKQGLVDFMPSRLFIYYQERLDQGDTAHDTGASIRESAKAVANYGVPPESDWPYTVSQFTLKPNDRSYNDATQTKISSYLAVAQDKATMQQCLASGYPIHVGFSVYQSFESATVAQNGTVPMPAPGEPLLGGHAVVVVGYNDTTQRWLCRNSWGTGWGQLGYFTMPYAYLLNPQLSSDFWTLRQVTGPTPPPPTPTPTPTPSPAPHKTGQIDVFSDGSYRAVQLSNPGANDWIRLSDVEHGAGVPHSH